MLNVAHLRSSSANVESALATVSGLAQDSEVPADIRERADYLSAELALLQRDLTARAHTLESYRNLHLAG